MLLYALATVSWNSIPETKANSAGPAKPVTLIQLFSAVISVAP